MGGAHGAGAEPAPHAAAAGTAGMGGAVLLAGACGAPSGSESQPQATKKPVTIKVTARTVSEAEMWPIRVPAFQQSPSPHHRRA